MRFLYIDAMKSEAVGSCFYKGVVSGIQGTNSAHEVLQFPMKESCTMAEVFVREKPEGVILSGSENSVTEPLTLWSKQYLQNLARLLDLCATHKTPVLGICFGHQALAKLWGFEVKRASVGLQVGPVQVFKTGTPDPWNFFDSLFPTTSSSSNNLRSPPSLNLMAFHEDQVFAPSAGASSEVVVTLTSNYCAIQGLAHKQHPFISVQTHPEMTVDVLDCSEDKLAWSHVSRENFITNQGSEILKRFVAWVQESSFSEGPLERKQWFHSRQ